MKAEPEDDGVHVFETVSAMDTLLVEAEEGDEDDDIKTEDVEDELVGGDTEILEPAGQVCRGSRCLAFVALTGVGQKTA